MNEDTAAVIQREGEIVVPEDDKADETPSDSHSEEENKEDKTPSAGGENNQTDEDNVPFHKHPRWTKREEEWTQRFNDQETRHQNDLKAIREEFGTQRKDNAQQTKIPAWFGGTQEQWDAYRTDRDAELKSAQEAAIERLKSEQKSSSEAESKAVEEATKFLNEEVSAIEADKTLNPTGAKIDRAALLKIVVDNELVDTKGRWNYRAGIRILNAGQKPVEQKKDPKDNDRKVIAAATTEREGKGDDKKPNYATSDDFKGSKRPW